MFHTPRSASSFLQVLEDGEHQIGALIHALRITCSFVISVLRLERRVIVALV